MIAPMRKGSLWHFFHNSRFLWIYTYICQKIKVMKFHEDPITINIFIWHLKLRIFFTYDVVHLATLRNDFINVIFMLGI